MNFKQLFDRYCSVLEKHQKQLNDFQFYPEKINEIKKSFKEEGEFYSYSFSTINLYVPKSSLPSHSIPKEFKSVEVILSLSDEVIINKMGSNRIQDPFFKLEKFNIMLYCEKKHYTSSWHLDRHVSKEQEGSSSISHPIYHLTFGGYHMENLQIDNSDEFGRALILRTPRIMHPPMELILGIDFIFNNFIPKSKIDLLSDPSYISVINELKKHFWLPFSLAIAKNFCERISIDNVPSTFDDKFVSSVLGN